MKRIISLWFPKLSADRLARHSALVRHGAKASQLKEWQTRSAATVAWRDGCPRLEALNAHARAAGRDAASVTLIAVSKTFAEADIVPVIAAGQRHFGENRVQEAKGKWPGLRRQWPDLRLHLIGPLQTNKTAEAVALFDAIHSIDRPKLAAMVELMQIAPAARNTM